MPKGSGVCRSGENCDRKPPCPAEITLQRLVIQAGQNNLGMILDILLNECEPEPRPKAVAILAELRELALAGKRTELMIRLRRMWNEFCTDDDGEQIPFDQYAPNSSSDLQNLPTAFLAEHCGLDECTATALEKNLKVIYLRDMIEKWEPRHYREPWASDQIGPTRIENLRQVISGILPPGVRKPYLDCLKAMEEGIVAARNAAKNDAKARKAATVESRGSAN